MRSKIGKLINSPLFSDPKKKAVVTIVYLGDMVTKEIDKVIRRTGLTIQQYNVLRILRVSSEKVVVMKVNDIKKRMTLKNSDVSRLLIRLHDKGLIDCKPDPQDKRAQCCSINERGLSLLAEIDKFDDEIFHATSQLTTAETEQLNQLFDKVLSAYPSD